MLNMASERYKKNASAVFTLKYHLVWCPKYRKHVLHGEVADRLKTLLQQKADELIVTIHTHEIMSDRVHLFIESDPTFAPAQLAAQFKGFTSRILRQEFVYLRTRLPTLWSRSYYVGSIGQVFEATVRRYIEAQQTKRD